MTFRDDRDAMRARIQNLERDLADAEARLAEREPDTTAADVIAPAASSTGPALPPSSPAAARPSTAVAWRPSATSSPPLRARGVGLAALLVLTVFLGPCALVCTPMTWTGASADPSLTTVDLDQTALPVRISGEASGWREPPSGCAGRYPHEPQILIRTSEPRSVHFALPTGNLLVALGPDGLPHCEPALRLRLGPGEHRVWVGTATGWPEPFELRLEAEGY